MPWWSLTSVLRHRSARERRDLQQGIGSRTALRGRRRNPQRDRSIWVERRAISPCDKANPVLHMDGGLVPEARSTTAITRNPMSCVGMQQMNRPHMCAPAIAPPATTPHPEIHTPAAGPRVYDAGRPAKTSKIRHRAKQRSQKLRRRLAAATPHTLDELHAAWPLAAACRAARDHRPPPYTAPHGWAIYAAPPSFSRPITPYIKYVNRRSCRERGTHVLQGLP